VAAPEREERALRVEKRRTRRRGGREAAGALPHFFAYQIEQVDT
jgi:hypothetical protein